jgi:sulfite reductase alpha subunit-like flavoprotein
MHRTRLLEFASPTYLDELYDYTTRPRRSILEVLQEFSTVRIPWHWAAALFPPLRGRQFSIASGGALKRFSPSPIPSPSLASTPVTTRIDILVAILIYRTLLRRLRRGVCTRYLATLSPGTELAITLTRGGFSTSTAAFEQEVARPVILVGPGTGVAPLRALVWERCALERIQNQAIGETVLVFGGRNRKNDFFFEDEWREDERLKVLTAFSRDQREKVYVQDVIKENAELMYRLLVVEKGFFYLCGSSGRMPAAVREAVTEAFVIGSQRRMNREVAEEMVKTLDKERRWKQETW